MDSLSFLRFSAGSFSDVVHASMSEALCLVGSLLPRTSSLPLHPNVCLNVHGGATGKCGVDGACLPVAGVAGSPVGEALGATGAVLLGVAVPKMSKRDFCPDAGPVLGLARLRSLAFSASSVLTRSLSWASA